MWYKLSERYEALYGEEKKPGFWLRPVFRYALAPICLVLLLGLGTGAYAYNSPGVNEHHPLYALKKGIEKVEKSLVSSPEKKAAYNLKQMQRRLAEIERLQVKNQSFEATLTAYNQAQEAGLAAAEAVTSNEARGILIQKITEQGLAHLNRLEQVRIKLPLPAQPPLQLIIQKQSKHLEERIQGLQEKQEKFLEKQLEVFEKIQEELEQRQEEINAVLEQTEEQNPLIEVLPSGPANQDQGHGRSGDKSNRKKK